MDAVRLEGRAEEKGLALMLQGLLSENIAASENKRHDFNAMSSIFALVAPDAEVTVTLAFDRGSCTLYDGLHGDPDLMITANSDAIPAMSLLQIRHGLPWLFDDNGKAFVRSLLGRDVRISVLVKIPPSPLRTLTAAVDLVRLTKVLSVNS